jgi:hypothetical protein
MNNSSTSLTSSELRAQSSSYLQNNNGSLSGRGADRIPPKVTKKLAMLSLVFGTLATILMTIAGIANVIQDFYTMIMLLAIIPAWAILRLVMIFHRQINQARFILREIESRKTRKATSQSSAAVNSTSADSIPSVASGDSTPNGPPRLPSLDISGSQRDGTHTTATEASPTFERLRRQDTEASLGLNALPIRH